MTRGDVDARLYRDEFAAALARADAEVQVAESGVVRSKASVLAARADEQQSNDAVTSQQQLLAEAEAQSRFAQAELQRAKDLLQQGIGSPRDVERSQSEGSMAEARVRSLEAVLRRTEQARTAAKLRVEVAEAEQQVATAQLASATAAQMQAKATLDKTDVKAPFDGVVVLKDAEVGEVVSPNVQGGSNARGAVCTMVDFDSLEVQANVPETALKAVQLGAPADVFLDAFPDRAMKGRVDRIWPTADRQKATVEVRVKLLERRDELRPEMGVRIVFRTGEPSQTTDANAAPPSAATAILPDNAIVEIDGKPGAFVVERDAVRFVEVRIAERKSGQVGVESGVRPGQTVVLEPPASLKTGDRIRIAGA
jgi:RND family efflux transporter MFP subunit